MNRETKWKRVQVDSVKPYLPKEHQSAQIDVACARILQYISVTEFSQILQITYKVHGEGKFNFTKHRIRHDAEEEAIKNQFEGILTYSIYQ